MRIENLENKESSGVVVTDAAAITALGSNLESLWQGLMAGKTAIRPITRFRVDQDHYKAKIAAHLDHIAGGAIEKILGGVCDVGCPQIVGQPNEIPPGAVFFMLEKSTTKARSSYGKLQLNSTGDLLLNGSEI